MLQDYFDAPAFAKNWPLAWRLSLKSRLSMVLFALLSFCFVSLATCSPASAADDSAGADANRLHAAPVISVQSISMAAALKLATDVMAFARTKNINIAVAVVDRSGLTLVALRDDLATEQFYDGAIDKAWSSVNFKDSTRNLADAYKQSKEDNQLIPFARKTLILMGGVPLRIGESIVGAVGVAGAVSGLMDDEIARYGAERYAEMVKSQGGKK